MDFGYLCITRYFTLARSVYVPTYVGAEYIICWILGICFSWSKTIWNATYIHNALVFRDAHRPKMITAYVCVKLSTTLNKDMYNCAGMPDAHKYEINNETESQFESNLRPKTNSAKKKKKKEMMPWRWWWFVHFLIVIIRFVEVIKQQWIYHMNKYYTTFVKNSIDIENYVLIENDKSTSIPSRIIVFFTRIEPFSSEKWTY